MRGVPDMSRMQYGDDAVVMRGEIDTFRVHASPSAAREFSINVPVCHWPIPLCFWFGSVTFRYSSHFCIDRSIDRRVASHTISICHIQHHQYFISMVRSDHDHVYMLA